MPETEIQGLSGYRLPDLLGMPLELVANGRANQIGAIGVEAFLYKEIDLAKVDVTKVDGDLLATAVLGRSSYTSSAIVHHLDTIRLDGT